MKLYLDDDTAERRLITFLANADHQITTPAQAQLSGARDAHHFIYAARHFLTLVTRNHDDFLDLHEVVQATQGNKSTGCSINSSPFTC